MSRNASPSGGSFDTTAPVLSNITAARKSLSPPSVDVSLRGMADAGPKVSLNQDSSSENEDDYPTSENTPLITSPTSNTSDTSSTGVRNRRRILELPDSVRCDCHEPPKPADKASRNRLMIACIIVLVFMIGEVVGSLCITLILNYIT